jgi:nucleotide-binding universal stress UspA family protein
MKNIIVPVDFSEDSLKGIELAVLFSKKTLVNIQMVYVLKKSNDFYAGSSEEEQKYAEKKFEKILRQFQPLLENESKLRYIIKKGKIYVEVVNQAQSYKDSIVIASTHGASGFEEFFIGSNALKIISATDRPVITIRKGNVPETINKIVCPIDVVVETRQKVPMTAEIARLFDAEVHVVTVSSSKSKRIISRLNGYSNQVSKYFKNRDIKYVTKSLFGDDVATLTTTYSKTISADFISIITEQGSSLSNLILGNHAHQVINEAEVPVLSITPKPIHLPRDFNTFGG